jgi:hypothetical protein
VRVCVRRGELPAPVADRGLDRLAEISAGFSRELIAEAVLGLDSQAHHVLFIDVRRRRQLARTVAPALGSTREMRAKEAPREKRRRTSSV